MHKANELLGREVLDQDTGEKRTTVEDLIFDDGTTKVLALVVDEGGLFRGARTVRWERVVNVGDVVMLAGGAPPDGPRDDPEIDALRGRQHRVTGTEIVTEGGEKVGEVADVLLDDGGVVRAYEVKRGLVRDLGGRERVPAEDVVSSGKDAIIVRDRPPAGSWSAGRRWRRSGAGRGTRYASARGDSRATKEVAKKGEQHGPKGHHIGVEI